MMKTLENAEIKGNLNLTKDVYEKILIKISYKIIKYECSTHRSYSTLLGGSFQPGQLDRGKMVSDIAKKK